MSLLEQKQAEALVRLEAMTGDDFPGNPDLFDDEEIALHKKYLRLGLSKIPFAGVGVFAARNIKKNTWIGTMAGEVVGTVDKYTTNTETDEGLLLHRCYGPLRYCNHAKKGNVYLEGGDDETWIYAARDIQKGEELVWDYGDTPDKEPVYETPEPEDMHPYSAVAWLQERGLWGSVIALASWLDTHEAKKRNAMSTRHDPSYKDDGRALKRLIHQKAFKERSEDEEPWTLKSGRKSRVYFDLRPVLLQAQGLDLATLGVADLLNDLEEEDIEFDAICGVLDGGASLASSLGVHYWTDHNSDVPILLVRKEAKEHGMGGLIMDTENVAKGSKVVVVEDVATTGGSAMRAVVALREAGYVADHCVAVLDREEGAQEALDKEGVQLHALYTKSGFSEKE